MFKVSRPWFANLSTLPTKDAISLFFSWTSCLLHAISTGKFFFITVLSALNHPLLSMFLHTPLAILVLFLLAIDPQYRLSCFYGCLIAHVQQIMAACFHVTALHSHKLQAAAYSFVLSLFPYFLLSSWLVHVPGAKTAVCHPMPLGELNHFFQWYFLLTFSSSWSGNGSIGYLWDINSFSADVIFLEPAEKIDTDAEWANGHTPISCSAFIVLSAKLKLIWKWGFALGSGRMQSHWPFKGSGHHSH